ncbi:hypothetical protein SAMN04487975_108138 [Planococcus glaciei]|uniref:hypothetical protein n=1 Tax=Planococcus glaciei TaxID=459472 RepID=UPI00088AD356|nr:hypothetical protein [Planococcus glaciei]SDH83836.1 hypothetical protein SAMN04487975_108138 [Planococcus glaciei]
MELRKMAFMLSCLFISLLAACGQIEEDKIKAEDKGTSESRQFNDQELIGTIGETNPLAHSLYVDHTEWINRHVPSNQAVPDIGYGFQALITDETLMKFENGAPADLKDFKPRQKVKVLPPTEETTPVEIDQIILLEMTYKEKYERFLAPSKGSYNVTVLYEEGDLHGMDVEKIFDKLSEGVELNAGQFPYTENWVVDYKKELGIEKLPVILVFDTEGLIFKTYQEKELYKFFDERIE